MQNSLANLSVLPACVLGTVQSSQMEDKIDVTDSSDQGGFNPNSDEFVSRLIDAVRREPCLYDSNHEHYGNKHASAQYRANVWQRLCEELQFPGMR